MADLHGPLDTKGLDRHAIRDIVASRAQEATGSPDPAKTKQTTNADNPHLRRKNTPRPTIPQPTSGLYRAALSVPR